MRNSVLVTDGSDRAKDIIKQTSVVVSIIYQGRQQQLLNQFEELNIISFSIYINSKGNVGVYVKCC